MFNNNNNNDDEGSHNSLFDWYNLNFWFKFFYFWIVD
jgi:hypothetical protein